MIWPQKSVRHLSLWMSQMSVITRNCHILSIEIRRFWFVLAPRNEPPYLLTNLWVNCYRFANKISQIRHWTNSTHKCTRCQTKLFDNRYSHSDLQIKKKQKNYDQKRKNIVKMRDLPLNEITNKKKERIMLK